MNYGQQPQLPSIDRADRPPLPLNLNTPPVIVPAQTNVPVVGQQIPLICAATALEIQNLAQTNPLRMFMYNLYSINGYNNQDFANLICFIVDTLSMPSTMQRYPSIEPACEEIIPRCVEVTCANLLRAFGNQNLAGAIQALGHGNLTNSCGPLIQAFDGMMNEIANWKRMGGQTPQVYGGTQQGYLAQPTGFGGMPTQTGWAHQQAAGGGYAAPSTGGMPVQNWRMAGNYGNPQAAYGNPNQQGSSVFTNNPAPAPGAGQPSNFSSRLSERYGQGQNQQQPQQVETQKSNDAILQAPFQHSKQTNPQANPAVATPATPKDEDAPLVLASEGQLRWKHSMHQYYPPAYKPSVSTLYYKQVADGSVLAVLRPRDPSMDYDRHKLPSVFGIISPQQDLSKTPQVLDRLRQGVELMAAEQEGRQPNKAIVTEGGDAEKTTVAIDGWIIETTESAAWFGGQLERMQFVRDSEFPDIFRARAQIAEPVVSDKDETETLKQLAACDTFESLADHMVLLFDTMTPEFRALIDRKLTRMVNRIVNQHLSIDKLSIDSFMSDVKDLIEVLGEDHGDLIRNAFLSHQEENIQAALMTLSDKHAKDLSEALLEGRKYPEGTAPKITFVVSRVSLTYLAANAAELEVEFDKNVASALLPGQTPELHAMAKSLFGGVSKSEKIDRHFVRTMDGRILELTEGYVGKDFYLIKLVR